MHKVVLLLAGVVVTEIQLTKDRTTLGRQPFNDIVLSDLAVSGSHAVLQKLGTTNVFIEDLNSTNGTFVNGLRVKKQLLLPTDTVELGIFKIRLLVDESRQFARTTNATLRSALPA